MTNHDTAAALTEARDRIMGPWAAAAEADGWDHITPDSLYWAAVDGIAWSLLDQTSDLADSGPSVESLAEARATAERALAAQPPQDDPQPDEREAADILAAHQAADAGRDPRSLCFDHVGCTCGWLCEHDGWHDEQGHPFPRHEDHQADVLAAGFRRDPDAGETRAASSGYFRGYHDAQEGKQFRDPWRAALAEPTPGSKP